MGSSGGNPQPLGSVQSPLSDVVDGGECFHALSAGLQGAL